MATSEIGVRAADELDELYRRHAAEVFRYTYAVLGNRADAEDVTQTTFVNALRALERGEQPRKPSNWLITIAHNLIRQRFRQQQARPHEVELDRDVAAAEVDGDAPSIDELVRALQRIPATQRQAIILRELEGRSYSEIGELLGVSQSALEALIFRARRSLAEELENLVSCDRAEFALSRDSDGRLGRKERRRLLAHLEECESCARVAARSMKHRRAFKVLAVLPLPFSLTFFKGAPSAYAAAGLPTIGAGAAAGTAAGTAAGVGAAGLGAKIAAGLVAVAVAGGAGYEGVQAMQEPANPTPPAAERQVEVAPAAAASPAAERATPTFVATERPAPAPAKAVKARPVRSKPVRTASKAAKMKPGQAAAPEQGRSAAAPGRTKTEARAVPTKRLTPARTKAAPASKAKAKPATTTDRKLGPKAKTRRAVAPATAPTGRGKSTEALDRLPPVEPETPKKPR